MTDLAIAWRDEQIQMLKAEIRNLNEQCAELLSDLAVAEDRAERAETALANLKEEVAEWRLTA